MRPHDLPATRRLPRPAAPRSPANWHDLGDGQWHYEGPTVACTVEVDETSYDELGARLDAVEAQAALLRYLRDRLVHNHREALLASREAGDAASAPRAAGHVGTVPGAGERLCAEVSP